MTSVLRNGVANFVPPSTPTPRKRPRQSSKTNPENSKFEDRLLEVLSSKEERTESSIQGELVATKLNGLDSSTRTLAFMKIMEVLMKFETKTNGYVSIDNFPT
jgi:hypothetical protein